MLATIDEGGALSWYLEAASLGHPEVSEQLPGTKMDDYGSIRLASQVLPHMDPNVAEDMVTVLRDSKLRPMKAHRNAASKQVGISCYRRLFNGSIGLCCRSNTRSLTRPRPRRVLILI